VKVSEDTTGFSRVEFQFQSQILKQMAEVETPRD
jgi:hypothetical protein